MKKRISEIEQDKIQGSFLGGAVGDALGYVVEFSSYETIISKYGESGITKMPNPAKISDDTQMTLFTAEGILRAYNRLTHKGICHAPTVTYYAYMRWLYTQTNNIPILKGIYRGDDMEDTILNGNLIKDKRLFRREAPGNSCLSALSSGVMGTIKEPINDSKGCGGVMRVAPIGLYPINSPFAFACNCAAITHGHPTGYLSAGALAQIISDICNGESLKSAIEHTLDILKQNDSSDETIALIKKALELSQNKPSQDNLKLLGEGWIAEEALGIALYCALCYPDDFEKAIILAVNHSGDSDSTGAICGNILGAILGIEAIPTSWINSLELKDLLFEIANDLHTQYEDKKCWWDKYPGC